MQPPDQCNHAIKCNHPINATTRSMQPRDQCNHPINATVAGRLIHLINATPTGLRLKAQGCCTQLPWDTNPRDVSNPNGVAAQCALVPHITFIPFQTVFPEQSPQFILKAHLPVMFFLISNVFLHLLEI